MLSEITEWSACRIRCCLVAHTGLASGSFVRLVWSFWPPLLYFSNTFCPCHCCTETDTGPLLPLLWDNDIIWDLEFSRCTRTCLKFFFLLLQTLTTLLFLCLCSFKHVGLWGWGCDCSSTYSHIFIFAQNPKKVLE